MPNQPRYRQWLPISGLLLCYLLLRLLFRYLPELKTLFIYPTGLLTNAFYHTGDYIAKEWIYTLGNTRFVLGESCSGTTFFSLVGAYLVYNALRTPKPRVYFLAVYPLTVIANSMRVLSSIYAQNLALHAGIEHLSPVIHVVTGTITFLSAFLAFALLIDRRGGHPAHAH